MAKFGFKTVVLVFSLSYKLFYGYFLPETKVLLVSENIFLWFTKTLKLSTNAVSVCVHNFLSFRF